MEYFGVFFYGVNFVFDLSYDDCACEKKPPILGGNTRCIDYKKDN